MGVLEPRVSPCQTPLVQAEADKSEHIRGQTAWPGASRGLDGGTEAPCSGCTGSPTRQVLWQPHQAGAHAETSFAPTAPRPGALLLLSWGLILMPSQARACAVHRGVGLKQGPVQLSLPYPPVATSWLEGTYASNSQGVLEQPTPG